MSLNLVSPGVKVREVDLTIGNISGASEQVGAFAAPFAQGPVLVPQLIESEQDLIKTFGEPSGISTAAYEYWMCASAYLSYGGVLRVVRTDNYNTTTAEGLKNAFVGTANSIRVLSFEDYNDNHPNPTDWEIAARNPGSWGNSLKVCAIDSKADQIITITGIATDTTTSLVGLGVTQALTGRKIVGDGTVTNATGFLRGVITGVDVTGTNNNIEVKVTDIVTDAGDGTYKSESVEYAEGSLNAFIPGALKIVTTTGAVASLGSTVSGSQTIADGAIKDWYDEQTLGLTNSTVYWKSIAERPSTSEYASQRSARNDEIHYVIVDDDGGITGISGNIIEKHLNLSKAKDGIISPSQNIYYKDYISNGSEYIFAGAQPASSATEPTGLVPSATVGWTLADEGNWSTNAQGQIYAAMGSKTYDLAGGKDYNGTVDTFDAELGDLIEAYDEFKTVAEYDINFLIMGPAAATDDETSAKARKLIAIAEERKDCIACISPPRGAIVGVSDSDTQTDNLVKFFDPLPSSSYAVFDSGYKYAFNRFTNEFRYIPMNPDIAGLMARTSIDQFSWFSPAGAARGAINGAIKLAYNPTKIQRDKIYPKRINPVIASPGAGIILFGDKTGLGYASAFDRINVRRLFLTIEQVIERVARDQLFEFNDIITRSSFLNVVDPYLRDVKAKRGITDYIVICDETNNTPDIIDSNQFRADIFVKPNRSINFIGLSFVATRTGVSFEEVVGNV